jgi:hypothetical protein
MYHRVYVTNKSGLACPYCHGNIHLAELLAESYRLHREGIGDHARILMAARVFNTGIGHVVVYVPRKQTKLHAIVGAATPFPGSQLDRVGIEQFHEAVEILNAFTTEHMDGEKGADEYGHTD